MGSHLTENSDHRSQDGGHETNVYPVSSPLADGANPTWGEGTPPSWDSGFHPCCCPIGEGGAGTHRPSGSQCPCATIPSNGGVTA